MSDSLQPKPPKAKGSLFEGLMFVAIAATIGAIVLLVLTLNRYEWEIPS